MKYEGRGSSKGAPRRDAARSALQYIHKDGLSDPGESQDLDAVLDLQNYLRNHPEGSLIPWFSCPMSQTGPGHHGSRRATVQCESFRRVNMLSSELLQSTTGRLATELDFPLTIPSK
jgi:hypothetical protein